MPFRRRSSSHDGLRRCPMCDGRLVCPIAWNPSDESHWHIELRCGDCGHRWERTIADSRAAVYDAELDRDVDVMKRALRRLDLDRMAEEADSFIAALRYDLIEPADFVS